MFDSIYHMTLKLLKNRIFGVKNIKILLSFTQHYNGCHYVTLINHHLWFINFIAWHYITPRRDVK